VTNTGTAPIGVVADPSLLWFEVAVPGKALPVTCRLPPPLWPKTTRRRAVTQLHPGERFSRRFDPRFFCFEDIRQKVLVVGARVTPNFGWPLETKEVRVKGKRTTVTLPPRPPVVAWALPAAPVEGAAGAPSEPLAEGGALPSGSVPLESDESEPAWEEPEEGLKYASGAAIVLAPSYAAWAPLSAGESEGLQLRMRAGSDAEDERSANVTIAVANGSSKTEHIFVRRELVTYHVVGPDGSFDCSPNEVGPPDSASFTRLAPRANDLMVVRLVEMCPRSALSRPGLYEVTASYTSHWSGQAFGLDAFVGTLTTPYPALIRIHSGDQPSFLRAAPIAASGAAVGANNPAPNAAEGEAPADGNADAPAEEVAPPDHEPAMEAPAPEAPADGTTTVE